MSGAIFGVFAPDGLIALLQKVECLFVALYVCGGLYLAFLGFQIWRGATKPMVVEESAFVLRPLRSSIARAFWMGIATQVANPKTAVVYASVFAALLPNKSSSGLLRAVPPPVLLTKAGSRRAKNAYRQMTNSACKPKNRWLICSFFSLIRSNYLLFRGMDSAYLGRRKGRFRP